MGLGRNPQALIVYIKKEGIVVAKEVRDLGPIKKLLDLSKHKDIEKLKEEKVLPLLIRYDEEIRKTPDSYDVHISKINETLKIINEEIDEVNRIYAKQYNYDRNYKVWSHQQPYTAPTQKLNSMSYLLGNRNYLVTSIQYNEIVKIVKDLSDSVEMKYLTIEAKIVLEKDFTNIAKILAENGIILDNKVK